jgi:WD40 repeat protein
MIRAQYRAHTKRVVQILTYDTNIISSSADGSIILYDLISEEIRISYKESSSSVIDAKIDGEHLFVAHGDKAIRLWRIDSGDILDIFLFDQDIWSFNVHESFLIIFFTSGDSSIYNFETKVLTKFDTFKRIRSVEKFNDKICVLCKKKVHIYQIRASNKKESLVLQDTHSFEVKDTYSKFSWKNSHELVFLSSNNSIETFSLNGGESVSISYHRSGIISLEIVNNCVVSTSEERIIVWTIEDDKLLKNFSIDLENGVSGTCIIDGYLGVCNDSGFMGYSVETGEKMFEYACGPVKSIHSRYDTILIGSGSEVRIIKFSKNGKRWKLETRGSCYHFEEVNKIDVKEPVTYLRISDDGRYFGVALLNSKINIYNFDSLDLKLSLYGHSLPVRYFQFSPDSKALMSCGTDKVIKLWGIDYGECRKTYIGDGMNVEMLKHNSSLFMFSSGGIKYYNKNDLLKVFKGYDYGFIRTGDDFFVASEGFGLGCFKMGRYELIKQEDGSETEDELLKERGVVNSKVYEKFLDSLERLERESSEENMLNFYQVICSLDLSEVNKYIYFLDGATVKLVVECIGKYLERNIIVLSRIFSEISRIHSESIREDKKAFLIYKKLLERIETLRNKIGCNLAGLSL